MSWWTDRHFNAPGCALYWMLYKSQNQTIGKAARDQCKLLHQQKCYFLLPWWWQCHHNKANLRDLIAATGQVMSNWIQIVNFSARVTVKFDEWPRKTIGHFFYTTSSFAHHFKSIGEFKLDLQSRNTQFGSKLVICYPMWPWNLMDDLAKQ